MTVAWNIPVMQLVLYEPESTTWCSIEVFVDSLLVTTTLTGCRPVAAHDVLYCTACTVYPVATGFALNYCPVYFPVYCGSLFRSD